MQHAKDLRENQCRALGIALLFSMSLIHDSETHVKAVTSFNEKKKHRANKGGLGLDHGTTINAVDEVGPDSCFGVSDFCLASCEHSSEQQKPPTTIRHQPLYGGRPSRSQPGLEMSNVGVSKECAGHTPGSQV